MSNLEEYHINELSAKLGEVAIDNNNRIEIRLIIDSIKNYAINRKDNYVTTQHVIEIELLFKG